MGWCRNRALGMYLAVCFKPQKKTDRHAHHFVTIHRSQHPKSKKERKKKDSFLFQNIEGDDMWPSTDEEVDRHRQQLPIGCSVLLLRVASEESCMALHMVIWFLKIPCPFLTQFSILAEKIRLQPTLSRNQLSFWFSDAFL